MSEDAARGVYNQPPTAPQAGHVYPFAWNPEGGGSQGVKEAAAAVGEDNAVGCLFTRPLASSSPTGSWTPYASAAKVGAAGVSVSGAPGNIRRFNASNSHATAKYYLLLIDKATPPVANDLPIDSLELPPNTREVQFPLDYGDGGLKVVNGVAYAISTTPEKVTFPATSDCMVFGLFK